MSAASVQDDTSLPSSWIRRRLQASAAVHLYLV